MFNKIWNAIDGQKSLICSISLLILSSEYTKEVITNPAALDLITNIFWLAFGGSVGHKVKKKFFGKDPV